ncbi:LOW QUALITY PROTEIN: uncharacterized protein LOC116232672 [Phasianus colchicus]|uniref:LOW QUALITY PROTEIN: uncharacterized protein LOC116232672 n=1 Tax=Phasianus colchicus TaxID=9054 RepID=UPI00129D8B36|nr:LOW QUALITY PROTEIN: uncharacterized protein LOC116232672 [Phasianus colchicus]
MRRSLQHRGQRQRRLQHRGQRPDPLRSAPHRAALRAPLRVRRRPLELCSARSRSARLGPARLSAAAPWSSARLLAAAVPALPAALPGPRGGGGGGPAREPGRPWDRPSARAAPARPPVPLSSFSHLRRRLNCALPRRARGSQPEGTAVSHPRTGKRCSSSPPSPRELPEGLNKEAAEKQSCAPSQHPLTLPVRHTAHTVLPADAVGWSRRMGVRPGWGWLLLPVCQALVVPKEVSGQEGETLSLRCWYARGYEGYNKYWCRGAARGSCRKVVETAGREVPRRHGRISITDNHIFCVVLLTVEELSMEDAGSYWCGVERAGRDIMEPVTVRVRPAPSPEPSNTTTEFPHTANITAAGAGLQKGNTSLQKGQEQPPSSPPSLSGPALQVLLPTMLLLFLLAVTGSAGLIHALWRRRRRREALQKPLGLVGSSQLCSPAMQAQQHHQVSARPPPGATAPQTSPVAPGCCGCTGAGLKAVGT